MTRKGPSWFPASFLLATLLFSSCSTQGGPRAGRRPAAEAPTRLMDGWSVGAPKDVGVTSDALERMTAAVARGRWGNIHAILIARRGRLIYEEYFTGRDDKLGTSFGEVPFNRETLHDCRSISKTVTATVVGIALDRGLLPSTDTPLV